MKLKVKSTEEIKKEKLNRDDNAKVAIEVMRESFDIQDDAELGIFWYDIDNDELFGTYGVPASTINWHYSPGLNKIIKTCPKSYEELWKKEHIKGKDDRFSGSYINTPYGKILEIKGEGFVVYTGKWINDFPQVKGLIVSEFNLPKNPKFIDNLM